jgi:hypothetical protein
LDRPLGTTQRESFHPTTREIPRNGSISPSVRASGKSRCVQDSTKRSLRRGLEICHPADFHFGKASAAAVLFTIHRQPKIIADLEWFDYLQLTRKQRVDRGDQQFSSRLRPSGRGCSVLLGSFTGKYGWIDDEARSKSSKSAWRRMAGCADETRNVSGRHRGYGRMGNDAGYLYRSGGSPLIFCMRCGGWNVKSMGREWSTFRQARESYQRPGSALADWSNLIGLN